ncbi:MAG: Gfo/Idh/MocA family oxidoreductase [Pirellulaceae bacterium]|nr:Gfo/Idh/MocA family oxidoreductase [Pirellulaceae bacterium]
MISRRNFLAASAAASALTGNAVAQDSSNAGSQRLRVGVMGLSRGLALAIDLAGLPGVEVAYLCEVDDDRLASAARSFTEQRGRTPQTVKDFRKILDDKSVDALVCAAPNHWHAPATIMACKAGKHVYVEKPCSHNPLEGQWMVAAAERFDRCVQMGTQRRSAPGTLAAIEKLHSGTIGKIHLSRCYYHALRGPIGKAADGTPPTQLDYDLWQGPAPRRPYRTNYVHYNWHWFWHWGGGELANNGVHGLDLCRWGLQVDYPTRTVSSGGRYWYDDDQETPDTQSACFEFADGKQITWQAMSCNKRHIDFFCAFYGDQGSLELDGDGNYRIYDRQDKLIEEGGETAVGQIQHLTNFVDCVRRGDRGQLNQPILEAHKSTLLCHLGNIAQRTGRTVNTDPTTGQILGDAQQLELWSRDYDPAWKEQVSMS